MKLRDLLILNCIFFSGTVLFVTCSDESHYNHDHDWDVLIFTQQWPVTACFDWVKKNPNHGCYIPKENGIWTVHGIWPTKYGTFGPSFCNKSTKFDMNELKSIEDQMKLNWPNIQLRTGLDLNPLWTHEWEKHGTCAVNIKELNGERNYFEQGLRWHEKFSMSKFLEASGINPDSSNSVLDIRNAVKNQLNKNPSIHCIHDGKTGTNYLSEIRICFNKTLELIDCDGVSGSGFIPTDNMESKILTNCPISDTVEYPSVIPSIANNEWDLESPNSVARLGDFPPILLSFILTRGLCFL